MESLGVFQSGQMGQTVNLLRQRFGGSNPSAPTKQLCIVVAAPKGDLRNFRASRMQKVYFMLRHRRKIATFPEENAEIAQLIEH